MDDKINMEVHYYINLGNTLFELRFIRNGETLLYVTLDREQLKEWARVMVEAEERFQ
jgi:hypothetical protein